jgi:hypothetical protein
MWFHSLGYFHSFSCLHICLHSPPLSAQNPELLQQSGQQVWSGCLLWQGTMGKVLRVQSLVLCPDTGKWYYDFETSLGYIMTPCLKQTNQKDSEKLITKSAILTFLMVGNLQIFMRNVWHFQFYMKKILCNSHNFFDEK